MKAEVEALGGTVQLRPTDLSDPAACKEMLEGVIAEHGRVDVLINNAGRSIRRSVMDSLDRFHDFERTMQLNYFGAIALIMAALPSMKEHGGGHIINITSIGGQTYPPRFAAYVASKAALDAYSRCLAPEVAADGIDITTVHMPLVRTPMIAPTGIYKNFPTISPEEAAEMVVQAMITRPHEVSTRLGKFGELTHAIAARPAQPHHERGLPHAPRQRRPVQGQQRRGQGGGAGHRRGLRAGHADARHPPVTFPARDARRICYDPP